jgi:hypothetical protein
MLDTSALKPGEGRVAQNYLSSAWSRPLVALNRSARECRTLLKGKRFEPGEVLQTRSRRSPPWQRALCSSPENQPSGRCSSGCGAGGRAGFGGGGFSFGGGLPEATAAGGAAALNSAAGGIGLG